MSEYQRLGVKLGLLINPKHKQVGLDRQGQQLEILKSPNSLVEDLPLAIDCSQVMPSFVLSLDRIW
jgi:Uma2 family endonuclease